MVWDTKCAKQFPNICEKKEYIKTEKLIPKLIPDDTIVIKWISLWRIINDSSNPSHIWAIFSKNQSILLVSFGVPQTEASNISHIFFICTNDQSDISFSNFFIKHLLHKITSPLSHICSQQIARLIHKKDEVLVKVKVFLEIVGNLDIISKITKTLIFGRVWDLSWC